MSTKKPSTKKKASKKKASTKKVTAKKTTVTVTAAAPPPRSDWVRLNDVAEPYRKALKKWIRAAAENGIIERRCVAKFGRHWYVTRSERIRVFMRRLHPIRVPPENRNGNPS